MVAVALVDDREMLDGWGLVPLKTITAVTVDRDPGCFEVRALKARSLWPPTSPHIELDRSVEVLQSAGAAYAVIGVSVRSSGGFCGRAVAGGEDAPGPIGVAASRTCGRFE